jgi:prepilin-type processing-associated H-X9-DG protein
MSTLYESAGLEQNGSDRDVAAFTLIELLVVFGIIVIIAALLLPVIARSKERANRAKCINNLHQIGVDLQNLLSNNNGYPTMFDNGTGAAPYSQINSIGLGIPHDGKYSIWDCPSARWKQPFQGLFSYWFNCDGIYSGSSLGLAGRRESQVVNPAEMMAFGDSFGGLPAMDRKPVVMWEQCGNARERHQGKGDVLLCDGHVESPTLRFLFEDTSDEALSRWNRDHQPHRERLLP